MVKAVFDELARNKPLPHFTVGIEDDVTRLSLKYDSEFDLEDPDAVRALFFGLGSDGTVGANKNSIKIIGEDTPNNAQGYFVYDSKKSGYWPLYRFDPRRTAAGENPFRLDSGPPKLPLKWLENHEYDSLEQMRGSMGKEHAPDRDLLERVNYIRVLHGGVG